MFKGRLMDFQLIFKGRLKDFHPVFVKRFIQEHLNA